MLSSTLRWIFQGADSTNARYISNSSIRFSDGSRLTSDTYKVNNFEKRLLVWMGKYKRIDDVPALVAPETVEKVRSWVRIRVANYMMALTLLGCLAMVYSGKKARGRGETLQQQNLDMHKKYKEDQDAKGAAAN